MVVDYSYFLNSEFKRRGVLIPAIGKHALGRPRYLVHTRPTAPVPKDQLRALPKTEYARAAIGTLRIMD